jgi:hypothetical protein
MTDVENLSRTGTRGVKRGGPGLTGNRNGRSADLQIFGRFPATVRDDVEAHLRAFWQAGVPGLPRGYNPMGRKTVGQANAFRSHPPPGRARP